MDAGYEAMLRTIRADKTPNLLVLQYSTDWSVRNLLLVPRVFFSESSPHPLRRGAKEGGAAGMVLPDATRGLFVVRGWPLAKINIPHRQANDQGPRANDLLQLP